MSNLREAVENYIKRVRDLSEHVRGNEQATKQSLIGPFFTLLGYDLTDPRECLPEYRADFGKERSAKPIDWAFRHGGSFAFIVEAKEVGKKLAGYDEQLADYFAKETSVRLGILTNGVQWRFYTDVTNANVMDREPFATWDVLTDAQPPMDVINLLLKTNFNAELVRAYAQRQRAQNLLVGEITRLLAPSTEFARLAITNLETRKLTEAVIESWRPIVGAALDQWARQRMLTATLDAAPSQAATPAAAEGPKVETTGQELAAFEQVRAIIGIDQAIAFEDSNTYFKVHLAEKRSKAFVRIQFGERSTSVWVPLKEAQATELAGGAPVATRSGWSVVTLEPNAQMYRVDALIRAAYQFVKAGGAAGGDE